MKKSTNTLAVLLPVLLCFFTMGFVDLVGTAANYVQQDHNLTASAASNMPMLAFLMFGIFSIPTGMLMNKIGRKKTVLLSMGVTLLALILPIFGNGLALMWITFGLLGLGNALMQTSLNPLVSNIVTGDKLASTLTFGQFVKAIASFLAPYIATWGATKVIPSGELGWRILFPIYAIVGILAVLALGFTHIEEAPADKAASFKESLSLLAKPYILLCFIGIICHVGLDLGINKFAPNIIMERLSYTLEMATFATSWYFLFRTIGCFSGSFVLRKMSARMFAFISVAMIVASVVLLAIGHSEWVIRLGIALLGLGNSNVFSICFSQALLHDSEHENAISGLMITGLIGGAIFVKCMGLLSDMLGVLGAIAMLALGAAYLLFFCFKVKKA